MGFINVTNQTTPATPAVGTTTVYVDSADNLTKTIDSNGVIRTNTGDVNGPASATNNSIALFDGVTGKLLKDSGPTVSGSTITASVTGNAGTATALQTGRTIDGTTFDGTANITVIAPGIHAATSKTTPVDADELGLVDSAASNVLKKLTWANLKATLKTYFDTLYNPLVSTFTSSDQTITAAGGLTIAHGLSSTPKRVHWELICQVADQNYAPGDVVFVAGSTQAANQGVNLTVDATNLNVRFGSQANVFTIINKTTGAANNITLASWKIRFTASSLG